MEQVEAVWNGKHIGDRQDDEHNILLDIVDGIYVGAYFHREYEVFRKLIPHANIDELMPYLGINENL